MYNVRLLGIGTINPLHNKYMLIKMKNAINKSRWNE
jgi:hypothetical protein